ncbi:hypothetical protein OS493_028336 [Desmophyllum pertusum]|uniref:C2H2-type domain-containing protein n=1 Tax=Desmophyllum pertusum TaxID=174260 RepID=A0A9W9YAS8_9CNID|nr:hypothetical protein OS493_028336 [Desmophyllum pertusum]
MASGKGKLGKMKIVRAKSMKNADQFYYTLRLARAVSSLEECFEVIRDYGGIQIEKQLMKSSSPFFQKLQAENCTYKFECRCSELKLQTGRKKCANCQHVHKSITQYEDLENLACVLILVEKGRMGDTFPQSFDCLDLRRSYDNSREFKEGSSLYLSTLIQELGRLCRYAKASANESPYVLVGRVLFKKLRESLKISPSMSAISCTKADRYMTKSSRSKGTTSSLLRWQGYEAHKDSYDHLNEQTHCNRILLQAEPQIGKTGTYLCLIKDLRLDIIGKENVSHSSTDAFDEGTFYQHKECDLSEEFVVNEIEGRQDWKFPYWRTIENSPSLYEKPVALGKYTIGGCFYTHDTEESPYFLMNPEQNEPTKSGYQHQKRDCADGIRAWHWYHFENCAECGRLLQGKESVWKHSRPSFHHVLEFLQSTGSKDCNSAVGSSPTLPYWIFHPSHRDDPRKCILNYHHVMQQSKDVANYVQVVVVRSGQFEAYRSTWGRVLVIIQLPDTLPNCELGPSEGGVGYTRLFIQKMAFSLNLEYVFVIDDNVAVIYEAVFNTGDTTATEGRVLRDENGVMKMQRCSFLKPLTRLQKIAQGKDIPPIDESKYEPHPLKDEFESLEFPLYNYSGPAKLFGDKQHESYGVLGLLRSVPIAVNPFSKTQVYAAILLNVKSTVEKGVFYRPWPCWEDLRFNDDCDKAGLWVVKCNRYSFLKVQYKDWINNLVLPKIFEWKDDSILEKRHLVSELPKDLEESIILEHLRSIVNIQGPEKCFKGSIGYDRQKEREDTISPTRIVEQLEQVEARESTVENPVLIISYCAANRTTNNMLLLSSTFCSAKEKIVFVTSAKEAIERWPQMTVRNISTHSGICFTSEMSDRNTQFAIFSAADPKRHSLRWILIEASFLPPQDNKDNQEEIITTRDEHVSQNRNKPKVEKITSSDRVQDIRKGKKSAKRSLQESHDDYNEFKRPKYEDCCSQRLEDVLPETSDDVMIIEERGSQETSQGGTTTEVLGNSKLKRKKPEAVTSELKCSNKEAMASQKIDISGSDEEGDADIEDGCTVSIVSENQENLGRKRDGRNDRSTYTERPNDVTKVIVTLWREYKGICISTAKKEKSEKTGSNDFTMTYVKEKLARFTTDQLEEIDEKGYNALLKACSLPSMSPRVMQYLITDTTKKVDIDCQLPHDFDRSTAKGLIPGMSALSVAINSGNVKLVSTFMRRRQEISIRSSDADGNTVLHHCVLLGSKRILPENFSPF